MEYKIHPVANLIKPKIDKFNNSIQEIQNNTFAEYYFFLRMFKGIFDENIFDPDYEANEESNPKHIYIIN